MPRYSPTETIGSLAIPLGPDESPLGLRCGGEGGPVRPLGLEASRALSPEPSLAQQSQSVNALQPPSLC